MNTRERHRFLVRQPPHGILPILALLCFNGVSSHRDGAPWGCIFWCLKAAIVSKVQNVVAFKCHVSEVIMFIEIGAILIRYTPSINPLWPLQSTGHRTTRWGLQFSTFRMFLTPNPKPPTTPQPGGGKWQLSPYSKRTPPSTGNKAGADGYSAGQEPQGQRFGSWKAPKGRKSSKTYDAEWKAKQNLGASAGDHKRKQKGGRFR